MIKPESVIIKFQSGDANRPRQYRKIQLALSLGQLALSLLFLLFLVFTTPGRSLAEASEDRFASRWAAFFLYLVLAGALWMPVEAALGVVRYRTERAFGLTPASFARWARFWIQSKALSAAFAVLVASILFFLLSRYPHGWWIPMALALFLLGIGLAHLFPTLLLPLFFPVGPLENPSLETKVQDLIRGAGGPPTKVYKIRIGSLSRKANAAFSGLGPTRRVLLTETLLDEFDEEEILAVVAHELAHQQLRHIPRGIALGFLTTVIGLGLAAQVHAALLDPLGFRQPAELAALPLLCLVLSGWGCLTLPIQNLAMRRWEFAADAFAARHASPQAMVSALRRLARRNLVDPDPPRIEEILFHDHPSCRRRIEALAHL